MKFDHRFRHFVVDIRKFDVRKYRRCGIQGKKMVDIYYTNRLSESTTGNNYKMQQNHSSINSNSMHEG